jgi:hypothetical protein
MVDGLAICVKGRKGHRLVVEVLADFSQEFEIGATRETCVGLFVQMVKDDRSGALEEEALALEGLDINDTFNLNSLADHAVIQCHFRYT